ncbi:MAG: exonuclease subunit SbcC [Cyanobacteriota bacterium]
MIPQQLILSNFLSYQQATLDFTGLHTACICGANGAGKSSLLEAITWVLWGKTRTASDEDVINTNAKEVQVDFRFQCSGETYRVLRKRRRGQSAGLELQVQQENGQFYSLTAKGVKATQTKINDLLKLDYDTFINSAYLRQGRADEFMMRSPSERKKVLAELLKLDQYETLSEQARDTAKTFKGKAEQLEQNLALTEEKIAEEKTTQTELEKINQAYQQLQKTQESDQSQLQHLKTLDSQRQSKQEQLDWYQQQENNLAKDCADLQEKQTQLQQTLSQLSQLLNKEESINQDYQTYLQLQEEEASLSQKFQTYQDLQQQRQQLKEDQQGIINQLRLDVQRLETELENVATQEQSYQKTLQKEEEINEALSQLQAARKRLQEFDQLQEEVSPLMQRRQTLQLEIEREASRKQVRLEQLEANREELREKLSQVPAMKQEYGEIEEKLVELEKKQNYSQRIQEKKQQQQAVQERLQQSEKTYQKQLDELVKKLELLKNEEAVCPLCETPLDDDHKQHVTDKLHREHQSITIEKDSIWEDLAKSQRALEKYHQEYEEITQELAIHDQLVARQAQLESQLDSTCDIHEEISRLNQEIKAIQESLDNQNYAQQWQGELQTIEQRLNEINYDEKSHAVARGEVERLRYAERKGEQLEEAKKELAKIAKRKPNLESDLEAKNQEIAKKEAELTEILNQIDAEIEKLGYARSRHNEILNSLRESQNTQLQYQELQRAKADYPQREKELNETQQRLETREKEKQDCQQQKEKLRQEMANISDVRDQIKQLETKTQQQRQQLDSYLSQKGKLEEKLSYLQDLKSKYEASQEQLQTLKRKHTIYNELSQAFGKNGIQTLMIENILPQLEAQTNHILSRLTGNQLHVQFLTQKASKGRSKKQTKLIDTLDIIIADTQGTRAYETYSGGEGFRINFAIRLALAKLLAQRAGTALQLLIIDEGFGTQDSEGCERLIAAINAIAPDFSCILAVTHMPQFKEAFQHRIEVTKTMEGSQLTLTS